MTRVPLDPGPDRRFTPHPMTQTEREELFAEERDNPLAHYRAWHVPGSAAQRARKGPRSDRQAAPVPESDPGSARPSGIDWANWAGDQA